MKPPKMPRSYFPDCLSVRALAKPCTQMPLVQPPPAPRKRFVVGAQLNLFDGTRAERGAA